jgi:hypothetical protein
MRMRCYRGPRKSGNTLPHSKQWRARRFLECGGTTPLCPRSISLGPTQSGASLDMTKASARCGVNAILIGEALMRGQVSIEELTGPPAGD